jgi:hypothetical protein
MTQAEFAKLLKTAAVTVGLYETTRPPSEKLLGKLEGIARREAERCQESDPAKFVKLKNIEQKFRILRIGKTWTLLEPDFEDGLALFRATDEEPACGYVFLKLETIQEIVSMRTVMGLRGTAAIEELNKALQKIAPQEYMANLMDARIMSSPLRLIITNEPEGTTTK